MKDNSDKGENPMHGNIIHVTVNNFMQPFPLKPAQNPKPKAKEVVIPDKNMISNLLSLSKHFNEKRKGPTTSKPQSVFNFFNKDIRTLSLQPKASPFEGFSRGKADASTKRSQIVKRVH